MPYDKASTLDLALSPFSFSGFNFKDKVEADNVNAAPRKKKFGTEQQKSHFFNYILEKTSLPQSCIFS